MPGLQAMRFAEGEPVYLIGSGDRVMCQGHVAYDPGPPSFVTVQYFIGGHWRKENKARSSLRPVKARRDEPIEDAPTVGERSGRAGADSARRDDETGRSEVESGRRGSLLSGGAKGVGASNGAGEAPVRDAEGARDGARARARESDDQKPPESGDHRGGGARTSSETIARATTVCGIAAQKAAEQHAPYNSAHEAYGVLLEEVAEFFDEVRKKDHLRSRLAMKNEAIDIAAVAIRIAAMYEDPQ